MKITWYYDFSNHEAIFQHLSNPTRYVCKLVKTFGGVLMMGGGKLIKNDIQPTDV